MAESVSIRFEGLSEFDAAIDRKWAQAYVYASTALRALASAGVRQAKLNATGRPGPNVLSGALRASVIMSRVKSLIPGLVWFIEFGPTMVYGRRVELGFTGMDSIGRTYNQPPYPYVGPSLGFLERIAAPAILSQAWLDKFA